ncbi:hypothetical protein [Sphingobacterium hungaricum]|uniref:Uncharacterized protein n=1 Tax=Sphingobacterium hungaricum TaxID=2082723 RepID=A0A928UXX8_9SPHI|nr:hypothetical protein [Sphingobacterium hungaricum]MBE8715270.1 hypothetical protein [Sphingobacterium hungaricum]
MAKRIKAIKCPQCGSTKQKEIDEHHFKCLNCDTEYILDSDDINIIHRYDYPSSGVAPVNSKKIIYIILALLAIPLFIFIFSSIFSTDNAIVKELSNKKYTWESGSEMLAFVDEKGDIKQFIVGSIDYPSGQGRDERVRGELYWSVYDIKSGKLDQVMKFNDIKENGFISSTDFSLKKFNDGAIYFVYKKNKIYKYDIKLKNLVQINAVLLEDIPQLKSGIGNIISEDYYYALSITSNTGKKVIYFPSTKIYVEGDIYSMARSNDIKMPNPTVVTEFTHSNSNPSYVIKYQVSEQVGYPIYIEPRFKVSFDENENPTEVTIDKYDSERSFVQNYKIINPESVHYKLKILGYTDKYIFICYKNSIQGGEKFHIQMLDYTGKIQWSTVTDYEYIYDDSAVSESMGVFFRSHQDFIWMNNSGKIEKTFRRNDITFDIK